MLKHKAKAKSSSIDNITNHTRESMKKKKFNEHTAGPIISPLRTTLRIMFKVKPKIATCQVLTAAIGIGLISYEPILIKSLFDSIADDQNRRTSDSFIQSEILSKFFLVSLIWIAAFFTNIVQEIIEKSLAPTAQKEIQNILFEQAVQQSPIQLNAARVGYISQSVKQAGTAVSTLITLLSYDFIRLLVMTIMALYVSTKLPEGFFTIILIWTVTYYATCYCFAKRTFPKFKIFSSAGAKSAGTMSDILNNVDLVRAFSKTEDEIKVVDKELNLEKDASEENRKYIILMNLIVYGGAIAFQSVFVYYSIIFFNKGTLTLGDVALAISLATILANNASNLCRQLLSFFEQTGNLSIAIEVIGQISKKNRTINMPQLQPRSGKISFKNVEFRHKTGNIIFKNLNLTINHGEKIGIVGKSGSGKTTFIGLLTKKYKPSSGIIAIGDIDLEDMSEEQINKHISQVAQDVRFLNRTIAENITYGCESATNHAISGVLQRTEATGFLSRLPHGLNSLISQEGIQMSGGEKQRLALARALLKKAFILIFDESTSAIDIEAEKKILDQISDDFENKTVIIVSHRLSTLKNMDKIIFIQDDATVEIGLHDELLKSSRKYYEWAAAQLNEFKNSEKVN